MMILYPNSRKKIEIETQKVIRERFLVSALVFVFLQSFNFSVYWALVCIAAIIVINSGLEAAMYSKQNIRVLKELIEFIDNLVFNYRYNGIIEEALQDTITEAKYEISLHANYIYELITKENYEDTLELYKSICPNSYFLMFYSMCYMVKQQGDRDIDGKSLFVSNMNRLISDINSEVMRQEKINYMFSGLFGVTLMPLFAIKPIEYWAKGNLPELSQYYDSRMGIMMSVLLAMISLTTFIIIKKMKYPEMAERVKNKLICMISQFHKVKEIQKEQIDRHYSKYMRRERFLRQSGCRYHVREFQIVQICTGALIMIGFITLIVSMGWNIATAICIGFCAGIIGFFIPYLSIVITYASLKSSIMSEITRLQSVIIMCMYQEGVDVISILTHMEMSAIYFKISIAKAVDEYAGSGMECLDKLKSSENNKSFMKLIDGLIACDNVPANVAFEFVEKDREYDISSWELKESKRLSDKAAIGKFISFIPIFATVGIKLIIPFVLQGISMLSTYTDSFQTMI